jgi:3-oxoacyl-[acyl-carrier-protein] synthase-3
MSSLYINYSNFFIPQKVLENNHFNEIGLTNEEIIAKSGIEQRRRTSSTENTNTMAIEAIKNSLDNLPYSLQEVDLIIGATYTPYDTIYSVAHTVQQYFDIANARCFTVDAACSSFINAVEIATCFFVAKKAKRAIIVCSENNSAYNNGKDKASGFLWGDGAAVAFISEERFSEGDIEIVDVNTTGLGNVGDSNESITLQPNHGGLKMPNGRDVFHYACTHLIGETKNMLDKNSLSIGDMSYFIPHQANKRITNYVAKQFGLPNSRVLSNIEQLGNTGCAGSLIALAQNQHRFHSNEHIVVSVFGGGYSSGSLLLKKI